MASILKRRGKYYSRVSWRNNSKKKVEKQIPLNTNKKADAIVRNKEVEKVASTIKNGMNWNFSWQKGGGSTELDQLSISEAVEKFIAVKMLDNLRPSTFNALRQGLDPFVKEVGSDFPIINISISDINIFKSWSKMRGHSPSTTNLCLQKIKSFLKYCYDMEYIEKEIKIDMLRLKEKPPMYLSEMKLLSLLGSESVELHYRHAFYFYAMTGCRLFEPFDGKVNGNWLIIDSDVSKTGGIRRIKLDDDLLSVLNEMRSRVTKAIGISGHGSKSASRKWQIKKYSRIFKTCAIAEGFGEHKFHNLRDTYATRRWAMTGDIHMVSKEIGHSSVRTTEKYANIDLEMLIDDFPSIAHIIKLRLDKNTIDQGLRLLASKQLQIA